MTEGIRQIQALLHDVAEHLKVSNNANRRAAARKLESIANLASTLADRLDRSMAVRMTFMVPRSSNTTRQN